MVTTCKVKTETATNVVYDKNDALVCAELTDLLPVAVSGSNIVKVVTVKVRS